MCHPDSVPVIHHLTSLQQILHVSNGAGKKKMRMAAAMYRNNMTIYCPTAAFVVFVHSTLVSGNSYHSNSCASMTVCVRGGNDSLSFKAVITFLHLKKTRERFKKIYIYIMFVYFLWRLRRLDENTLSAYCSCWLLSKCRKRYSSDLHGQELSPLAKKKATRIPLVCV